MSVSELASATGIRQANLSQHLTILRQLGILAKRRDGLNIYYSITDDRIIEACELVRATIRQKLHRTNRILEITRALTPAAAIGDDQGPTPLAGRLEPGLTLSPRRWLPSSMVRHPEKELRSHISGSATFVEDLDARDQLHLVFLNALRPREDQADRNQWDQGGGWHRRSVHQVGFPGPPRSEGLAGVSFG